MYGLVYEDRAAVPPAAPNRMDIACFAGMAELRPGCADPGAPVALANWEAFGALFVAGGYLAAAVRSFFRQGGRCCYVVRAASAAELIPGFPATLRVDAMDRATWRGAAQILGLPDVAILCLPDLAAMFAPPPAPIPPVEQPVSDLPERFVECAARAAGADEPPAVTLRRAAPRYDDTACAAWTRALSLVDRLLGVYRPDVQCVAALPLPQSDNPLIPDVRSRYVQLAYPWLRTDAGLEPPDGVLAGLLARNALTRGAFHSAVRLPLMGVTGLQPVPGRDLSPARRLSMFVPEPSGIQLISDVTTDPGQYRPAAVQRLFALLLRAAARIGSEVVFENSGEALWRVLEDRMAALLLGLYQLGALRGARPADAFDVRCDRSTMSQSDLDNGRAVVEVNLQPAAPVERITVALALDAGGVRLAEGVPA